MRILAINDLYPPEIRGGAEVIMAEAVDGLRERGHEVVVATGARGRDEAHVSRCLEHRPSPRWHGGRAWLAPWRAVVDYRRAFHNRHNETTISNLLAELRPDVVYLGCVSGVTPCSVLRALRDYPGPVVAHLHEYWLPTLLRGGSDFSRLHLPWLKRLLIGLDIRRDLQLTSMIAVSQTLRDRYLEAGFAPEVIEAFPNGLRLSSVDRPEAPARDRELRLLFVGRLDPEKGPDLLLERLAILSSDAAKRRIRCDVVGPPGPPAYMRHLRELAGALGESVRLLGPVERAATLRLYAEYDAVVVPSLWREPFSLVVPEALAAGAAVVASRWIGAAEWFEDGRDLLLFSPEAPQELDQAIRRLRDDPALAARLADAGKRKAGRVFDREVFLGRLESHLERALERPKLSPLLSERQRLSITHPQRASVTGTKTPDPVGAASRRNERPLVSVVVPCYNGSRTIRRALVSLMAQDFPSPYEVIVVDSSSDGTSAIVREEFPQVQLVRQETKTPVGAARNLGVRQARGDIIAFFDSDCVADPGWLRRLIVAHESDVAGVGGSVANGNPGSLVGWASFLMEFSRLAPSSSHRLVTDIVGCNSSYKRLVFEKYGFYHDGHFAGDDVLFNQRLVEAGERLMFEPRAVIYHLNRERIGDFLRHMRHLGEGVGFARLFGGTPHSHLSRHSWLAAAVLPIRVGRIAWRGLRWHFRDAWRLPAVLPLVTAGLIAFTFGELGARRSPIRNEARAALSSPTHTRSRGAS